MTAVFRADASVSIGSGHIMRCLTLADELRDHGVTSAFICRDVKGSLCNYVEHRGYAVHCIPGSEAERGSYASELFDWKRDSQHTLDFLKTIGHVSWLVVDHYGVDARWERPMRAEVDRILVIDDLANRKHDCDLLLDQNLTDHSEFRYGTLVPDSCTLLLGPSHALLRPQFRHLREAGIRRDGAVHRILVFFGGSDPTNQTMQALEALEDMGRVTRGVEIDVVVGQANSCKEDIERRCLQMNNAHYHCQVEDMAAMMARADLCLGAGGTATWERCIVGCPTITVDVASNQTAILQAVANAGAARHLGESEKVNAAVWRGALEWATSHPDALREMSWRAMQLMELITPGELTLVQRMVGDTHRSIE